MTEYSSISVSTYDPDALVGQLNDKSSDGWDVVAIVPTGSTITAYLAREGSGEPAADTTEESAPVDTGVAAVVIPEPAPEPEPVVEAAPEPAPEPEPVVEAAPEPTPEPAAEADPSPLAPSLPAEAAAVAAAEPVVEAAPVMSPHPNLRQGRHPSPPQPAAEPAAQPAASAAPAGWYADPSGRFELRYWDGGTWTEHVSPASSTPTHPSPDPTDLGPWGRGGGVGTLLGICVRRRSAMPAS
ncbi:MAG: DUF2510 domain-containing protein [Ilumatobacteraceae bacterium]